MAVSSFITRILRRQRRSAAATALIVTTLATALGLATAMLSVADALLVRAVPFHQPDRLVAVTSAFPSIRLTGMNLSGPEALEFQQLTQAFAASGPYRFTGLVVQAGGDAELATGVELSKGALDALRIAPAAGRMLTATDFNENASAVAMIGDGLWKRAFGADLGILGRTVEFGGVSTQVVGILPPQVTLLNRSIDLALPLAMGPGRAGSRSDHGYNVVARLADRRSLTEAAADLERAVDSWREETGEMHVPTRTMHPLRIQPLTEATTGLNREPVGALVAAVAFVLLMACANVSNLMVVRAERHRPDLAIQLALGATRGRLLRESVAESVALTVAGGIGGLAIASWMLSALHAAWPAVSTLPIQIEPRTLVAAAALACAIGVIVGIVAVTRLDLRQPGSWLRSGSRASIGGARRGRFHGILIAVQVALAVLLCACAGLMLRSLATVLAIDPGIRVDDVLRAQVSLPERAYPDDGQVWAFYEQALDNLRQQPGVLSAAAMSGLPPQRRANNTSFLLDGVEVMDHASIRQVEFVQHVTPEYLRVFQIPLAEGRVLAASDDQRSAPVALVNQTLAARFWPGQSAVGHRLKPAGNIGVWFTVVGVVADVRQNGVQQPAGSEIYVTHRQARRLMSGYMPRTMNLVVRTAASQPLTPEQLRTAVRAVDRTAAVSGVTSMQTIVDRSIAQPRLLGAVFGSFALLALAIAAVGVYAVTAYAVGTRTAEFGVRLALGATPASVIRLVLRGGAWMILAGLAAGVAGATAVSYALRNLLFQTDPFDPLSLASAAAAITSAAFFATIVPARRAARVDPLIALRG